MNSLFISEFTTVSIYCFSVALISCLMCYSLLYMLLNSSFSIRLFKGVDLFILVHNTPDYLMPCLLCYHGKVTDNKRQDPSPTKVRYPALATPYTEVYENMQDNDNPLRRRKQSDYTKFLQLCPKQSSVPSAQMPLWSVRLPIRPWLLQKIC